MQLVADLGTILKLATQCHGDSAAIVLPRLIARKATAAPPLLSTALRFRGLKGVCEPPRNHRQRSSASLQEAHTNHVLAETSEECPVVIEHLLTVLNIHSTEAIEQ